VLFTDLLAQQHGQRLLQHNYDANWRSFCSLALFGTSDSVALWRFGAFNLQTLAEQHAEMVF